MFKNVNMLLEEDNIASLEENVSVLNTETTISDKKKTEKESSSLDLSLSKSNKLWDKVTYLREECKIKNCIIQTLLRNQKVIQNTVNSGRFDKNTIIHTESFIAPKKFALNIRTSLTKHISTSNGFE